MYLNLGELALEVAGFDEVVSCDDDVGAGSWQTAGTSELGSDDGRGLTDVYTTVTTQPAA